MSNANLEDDLVHEYLAESREHLATIENDLLTIEQAGSEIDEQLVNRVFRAAHSIKGGAGFFDLLVIKELGHRTESVLDLIRSRQMVPTSEIVSVLLMAFDKLRSLLADYRESNSADISEFTSALSRLTDEKLTPDQKKLTNEVVNVAIPGAGRTIAASALDLDQAQKANKGVFAIEYDLIHDVQRLGRTPLDVLNQLVKTGTILDTAVDLDSAGTLEDQPSNKLVFDVLYVSALDLQSLALTLDLPPDRIRKIEPPKPVEPAKVEEPVKVEAAVEAPKVSQPSAPAAAPKKPKSEGGEAKSGGVTPPTPVETTVRLNVALLDGLMTLAGELVLGRNQLNEAVRDGDTQGIRAGAHRISLVTSELQEAVSLTRMQPVSGLFSKFPRLVRDLANELGKEIQLKLEGGEVELDKTILEGLSDPLTHMVRNSVDHGIEAPADRKAANKPATGVVTLRAKHQAGQVMIEISDDGKGLSGDKVAASCVKKGVITAEQAANMSEQDKRFLIFLPGVSTAEKLSNVSGRGVGMDVVKTNLDKMGGKIEIDSVVGSGSSFRIKLPLTLAIMPSLLVSDSGDRFAIPQASVSEMLRIPASQIADRIDRAGDAEVVLLRDRLVPLVYLNEALGMGKVERGSSALNIVLVDTGTMEYGLVVENLHDTVEIVLKPLGRHLQALPEYAGATILGDGQVAVVLDVEGLAERSGLSRNTVAASKQMSIEKTDDLHSLLLFQNAPGEDCAVPIELVTRVERIRTEQVQNLGGRRTMQYGGSSLPLVTLHDVASVDDLLPEQQWVVIVFDCAGRSVGLLVAEPLDMIETAFELDAVTMRQPGVAGSALLNGRTVLMLDIFELADTVRRRWPESNAIEPTPEIKAGESATVLVAEDSDFFRGQIRRLIEAVGYKVLAAPDGEAAWDLLNANANQVSVVTTDLEMPKLDGFGLTKRIRADSRFARLPVIALSTLAADEDVARGMALGVSEYQVKLDQNQLLESIRKAVKGESLNGTQVSA